MVDTALDRGIVAALYVRPNLRLSSNNKAYDRNQQQTTNKQPSKTNQQTNKPTNPQQQQITKLSGRLDVALSTTTTLIFAFIFSHLHRVDDPSAASSCLTECLTAAPDCWSTEPPPFSPASRCTAPLCCCCCCCFWRSPRLACQVGSPLENQVENPLENQVENPLANQVGSPLENLVRNQVENPLANPLLNPQLNLPRSQAFSRRVNQVPSRRASHLVNPRPNPLDSRRISQLPNLPPILLLSILWDH